MFCSGSGLASTPTRVIGVLWTFRAKGVHITGIAYFKEQEGSALCFNSLPLVI